MIEIVPPIRLNDKGKQVQNIHFTLYFFMQRSIDPTLVKLFQTQSFIDSFSVEASGQVYGELTAQLVQESQKKFGVKPQEPGNIDRPTADVFNNMLKKFGGFEISVPPNYPFSTSDPVTPFPQPDPEATNYKVSGKVLNKFNEPITNQKLIAYDVDLKGARLYRTAKTISEFESNGGVQLLNTAVSDNNGFYELTFTTSSFEQNEFSPSDVADVIVFAIQSADTDIQQIQKNNASIIGRSALSVRSNYSGNELLNWDVSIEDETLRGPTEYSLVRQVVDPFMKENNVELKDLKDSADQINFLTSETNQNIFNITQLVYSESLFSDDITVFVHQQEVLTKLPDPVEFLYAIGRQNILLNWQVLALTSYSDLQTAIQTSINENIIRAYSSDNINNFLKDLENGALKFAVNKDANGNTNDLITALNYCLPGSQELQIKFLSANRNYTGPVEDFWLKELPARGFSNTEINALQLTNQLSILTGNHLTLMQELQVNRGIKDVRQLVQLNDNDWKQIVEKTGVPTEFKGSAEDFEKIVQAGVNTNFPNLKIASMVQQKQINIPDEKLQTGLVNFLSTSAFRIDNDSIFNHIDEIKQIDHPDALNQLKIMQRIFQVSPTPEVLAALLNENKLTSARQIADIPEQTFINKYAGIFGNADLAASVHSKAVFLTSKLNYSYIAMREVLNGLGPVSVLNNNNSGAVAFLQNTFPGYKELLSEKDICFCDEGRSILSPAAYLVDLLKYLSNLKSNDNSKNPLDLLFIRRPDIGAIQLTTENTFTIIPYIDLVNEIMEFYTVNGSITEAAAYDTGDATKEELRANPQNTNQDAYRILSNDVVGKTAVYPITLPYNQPLDSIRVYASKIKTSLQEIRATLQTNPNDINANNAISAETLHISPAEYIIMTGFNFDKSAQDILKPWQYYGYKDEASMLSGSGDAVRITNVKEFIYRTQITYSDLIDILLTRYVNPGQPAFKSTQELLQKSGLTSSNFYNSLAQINSGTAKPTDPNIISILSKNNITDFDTFKTQVSQNFSLIQQIITLFESDALCDVSSTYLRTIQSIYDNSVPNFGISTGALDRIQRFIRLWRKLGWDIFDLDTFIAMVGETNITDTLINNLALFNKIKTEINLTVSQLGSFWGFIETFGNKSLFKALFLNKSVQQIDQKFIPGIFGIYFESPEKINQHLSIILQAFHFSSDELKIILDNLNEIVTDLKAVDAGYEWDISALTLVNLSIIYRYVLFSRTLDISISDVITLSKISGIYPFTLWNNKTKKFGNWDKEQKIFSEVNLQTTYDFIQLYNNLKKDGFKISVLNYILTGMSDVNDKIPLRANNILQTLAVIKQELLKIENDYPELNPADNISQDELKAKMQLIYPIDIVDKLIKVLNGIYDASVVITKNLNIDISKIPTGYSYLSGSGNLVCSTIMSDDDRTLLKNIPNTDQKFKDGVDTLYNQQESFLKSNFSNIFGNQLAKAYSEYLNHTSPLPPGINVQSKMNDFYKQLLPILKIQLQYNSVNQNISSLINLEETTCRILIGPEKMDKIVESILRSGLSATYINGADINSTGGKKIDDVSIDFGWDNQLNAMSIDPTKFTVRWETYLFPTANGDYTFSVDVTDKKDEIDFKLNDIQVLFKDSGMSTLSLDTDQVTLSAGGLYHLILQYTHSASTDPGIRLLWRTTTQSQNIIDSNYYIPGEAIADVLQSVSDFYRAALFINGFNLSSNELQFFTANSKDFDNIDFTNLIIDNWQRMHDYINLRNDKAYGSDILLNIFLLAGNPKTASVNDIFQIKNYDSSNLTSLVSYFKLQPADFKNEKKLIILDKALKLVQRTGISADKLIDWSSVNLNFDSLWQISQEMKQSLKANYKESELQQIATTINNVLRENQKQALISFLCVLINLSDADKLYEYLLIDVNMDACMDTSRIRQAISSVQLFVARVLLGLESNIDNSNKENGVAPDVIDTNRWNWMKYYRVWQANREVFLFPENWLDYKYWNDKSPFLKELESDLLQNDITADTAETAFRNYLEKLDEVSNLEICGVFQDPPGSAEYTLHIFARTHHAPYHYYYRTCKNKIIQNDWFPQWSPWEQVSLDIRSVEDTDKPGVHLMPIVWKNRLYLFWPEFTQKQQKNTAISNGTIQDIGQSNNQDDLAPIKYWEIKLAWSEYKNGKWLPKKLSKEFFNTITLPHVLSRSIKENYNLPIFTISPQKEKSLHDASGNLIVSPTAGIAIMYSFSGDLFNFYFKVSFDSDNQLEFSIDVNHIDDQKNAHEVNLGEITISDIHSKIESNLLSVPTEVANEFDERFTPFYMGWESNQQLSLYNNTYLTTTPDFTLQFSNQVTDFSKYLRYPFFYQDAKKVYFVCPPKQLNNFLVNVAMLKPFQTLKQKVISQNSIVLKNPGISALASNVQIYETNFKAQRTVNQAAASFAWKIPPVGFVQSNDVLKFYTFYHPFTSQLITNLNSDGIPALLSADLKNYLDNYKMVPVVPNDDGGKTFENLYHPGVDNDLRSLVDKTLLTYKENLAFDNWASYSQYNWELFYHIVMEIATSLSTNGKYAEAMQWFHYIFNPTTNIAKDPAAPNQYQRYWNVAPFKMLDPSKQTVQNIIQSLQADPQGVNIDPAISDWLNNPIEPFIIAKDRPVAFMKNVVMKYIDNLIAWGDSLYMLETIESINEATQLYVIAAHILGPKPLTIPQRGQIKIETFNSLKDRLSDISDAMAELENQFPNSGGISFSDGSSGSSLLNFSPSLYFCIPDNDQLLQYWDTIANRLFNIRHCKNIAGLDQTLALFEPRINPELLIQAQAQGLSIGSILADLDMPAPFYRFNYMLQKANEFCNEVKSLAAALLSTLEKGDAEALARLHASQEAGLLNMMTAVKEKQVLEAEANKESLIRSRETAKERLKYYAGLIGLGDQVSDDNIPEVPDVADDLPADYIFDDTRLPDISVDLNVTLSSTEDSGVKVIPRELEDLILSEAASQTQLASNAIELAASNVQYVPDFTTYTAPFGVGITEKVIGGSTVGSALSSIAKAMAGASAFISSQAASASKMASYIRREQEWIQQVTLAEREIQQIDKQIIAAKIRLQIANKELENHKQQAQNAQDNLEFLQNKFTNQELYSWMKNRLYIIYRQSYNFAYDLAKKVEKVYRFELGVLYSNFIQYGYWNSTYQGLLSGDSLQLALKQMEKSFIEENRREFELIKHISLKQLNPLAMIQLKETGVCNINLPEELFDFDYPGHYFRRIKSVSLSIPCIAGPYTTVNSTLRLLRNSIRIKTIISNKYEHNKDGDILIDDDRYVESNILFSSIATSSAQNDSGMFELNFRDERYLPFEGAGVISSWQLELNGKYLNSDGKTTDFSQFDYDTISDIIIHIKYTAREDAGEFRQSALENLKTYISKVSSMRLISFRNEYPTEWYMFLCKPDTFGNQVLKFNFDKDRFPFFINNKKDKIINIDNIQLIAISGNNQNGLEKQGIYFLTPDDIKKIKKPLDDPTTQGKSEVLNSMVDLGILQASFSSASLGDFMVVNKNGNIKLDSDNLKDLLLIIFYSIDYKKQ